MTGYIQARIEGSVGRLTLNRSEALHALNSDMCTDILAALNDWKNHRDVQIVLIDHAEGTRGFCAGGDIRMLAASGAGDGAEARAFFAVEYRMNVALHNYPKPILALIDGVTMGGGVGLSVHGTYRVATERTLFAMPETGIGLFPDVGGGWFLPRLEGELGTWLALTGARLKGTDVKAAGVATHFIPSELLPHLKSQIQGADFSHGAEEMLGEILNLIGQDVPEPGFGPFMETINHCFGFDRAEEIVAALRADGSDWAREQADTIVAKSPRTVKVALRQLREGAQFATFEENMRNEYRIGARQVQSADFLEGVRAVIVDKDHAPKWNPPTLEGVSETVIDEVFAPLTDIEELTF
jgi:enoyl-CoA hydratase